MIINFNFLNKYNIQLSQKRKFYCLACGAMLYVLHCCSACHICELICSG